MTNFFLFGLALSFLLQLIFFVFAFLFKTDKVTDLSYSLSFFLIVVIGYFFAPVKNLMALILVLTVSIWAFRLGAYLLLRIILIKADDRFDNMRNSLLKFGAFWVLQAVTVWILTLPILSVFSTQNYNPLSIISILGIFLWLLGFIIEALADAQKFKFKRNPENKDKWIQTGLWRYSRHPNYFGDILVWWGIFIISLPVILQQSAWHLLTILSPLFISYMLIFVSGIPLLEKKQDLKYKDNKDYQAYKAKTNRLIIWFY